MFCSINVAAAETVLTWFILDFLHSFSKKQTIHEHKRKHRHSALACCLFSGVHNFVDLGRLTQVWRKELNI